MPSWPGGNGPPVIPASVIIDSRRFARTGQYLGGELKHRRTRIFFLGTDIFQLIAAGYIILTHDILILLPREVQAVWRAKSSFLKWAYLIDRYFTWCFHTLVMIGEWHWQWSGVPPVERCFCQAWAHSLDLRYQAKWGLQLIAEDFVII